MTMIDTGIQPTLNYGIRSNPIRYRNKSTYDTKLHKNQDKEQKPDEDSLKILIRFLDEKDEEIKARDRYIEQLERLLMVDANRL